jgi:TRAP-type mannitol/chloroaromatic compound transport system permease small subunit
VQLLNRLLRAINALNRTVGKVFSWLALGIVITCFWVVVERYLFSTTRLWMQDLYVWLNGAMFTAVAGFALLRDDHVRVDMFYARMSPRGRAIVDLGTVLFGIVPLCLILGWFAWFYVQAAWQIREGALFFGGLPYTYLLKTVILGFVVLLLVQALAIALRCIAVIGGTPVDVFDPPAPAVSPAAPDGSARPAEQG